MPKQLMSAIYPLFNYEFRMSENPAIQKFVFSNGVILRKITCEEIELY
jgi:hypothetical protein